MKNLLLTCVLCFIGSLYFLPAFAADELKCPTLVDSNISTMSPEQFLAGCKSVNVPYPDTDRIVFIKSIASKLIRLGTLLAVGALVWAGIQYTKSFGDDEALKKAKSTALYAIIGLFLLLFSFGLVPIIVNFFSSLANKT